MGRARRVSFALEAALFLRIIRSHLRISVETVNYVYAVLYKYIVFERSDRGPEVERCPDAAGD